MNSLILIKKEGRLIPAYDSDRVKFNSIPENELITCDLDDRRRLGYHRRYFALLKFVFENMSEQLHERIFSIDMLRAEIAIRTGNVEVFYTFDGKRCLVPLSISFTNMGQKRFEKLYSDTLDICLKNYLPEVDRETYEMEIINFM